LPADKLQNYVSMNARVTSGDVRERFLSRNEKVKARYVGSTPAKVQLPEGFATEEKARAYYDAHKDDFKVGEQAVLEYVRASKLPSAADSADAREDLEKVRSEILGGADFAELARTWSAIPRDRRAATVLRARDMV
jgi:peptidyl-prolyl cis-trans isomerase D